MRGWAIARNCDGDPERNDVVFAVGWKDGRPRLTSTVCPIRVIDAASEVLVAWFLQVLDREPWSGTVIGVREWPRRGSLLRQPAVLVEAVQLLTAEFNTLIRPASKSDEPKNP